MLLRSSPTPNWSEAATTPTLLLLPRRPLSSINVPAPKKQHPPFIPSSAAVAAAERVTVEINGKPIEVPGYSTVRGFLVFGF